MPWPRFRKKCERHGRGDGWTRSCADVRYSMRALSKSWGFSLGTVAVLGLGIGATVAIFSVVNAVLLRPLPYPDAERIVSVETFWSNTGQASQNVSGPDFLDWKAQNNVFEKMAVFYGNEDAVTHRQRPRGVCKRSYVSADFFEVFGQTAAVGRLLTERDVPTGEAEPTVAVVGQHWAVANFGSANAAIGKTITRIRQSAGNRRRVGAGISAIPAPPTSGCRGAS